MRSRKANIFLKFVFLLFLLGRVNVAFAQSKEAARYEIDAKRLGVYPSSKDALPRSREFIRLDSTYYVGWMFEGLYKNERASDYLGYRFAITPLHKALTLLEKDFGGKLKNIFTSLEYFQQYALRFDDFYQIAEALKTCYNSIEMPDSVMSLLDRIESYHFQKDYFSINSERAWTYHRNRFYTSEKFSFLKNSIEENEKMAFQCCYDQITLIKKNKAANDMWYGENQSETDLLTVYHYIAILHDYNANYDSSEYYYRHLMDGGMIVWGNYAHLQEEQGNFADAIMYFSRSQYRRRYSLSESDYYLPSLLIYGARTTDAIGMARQRIAEAGSTPGFGWYNIALARGYLYDGQLDSSEFFLNKAANFRELHIGTTLTQSQYDFTINLLRVQLMDKKISVIKFFNPGWWYSPTDLYNIMMLKLEKLMLEYSVVNALAHNPERKKIMYDLFCSETTVTYDESMYLMKEFSLPFFQNMYESYQENDPRGKVQRYFRMFAARFKLERGDEEEAGKDCEKILTIASNAGAGDPDYVDRANERLFAARVYEILCRAYDDDSDKLAFYRGRFYEEFPQLVPFSGVKMKMSLSISGTDDETISKVVDEMKACNVEFTEGGGEGIPQAAVQFNKKDKDYQAVINVVDASGRTVTIQQMIFRKAEGAGKELTLRLFGKGGATKFEAPAKPNAS
jgi:hypothetical protein